MSLVDSRLSSASASGPSTLNFDISDMSITPTASRTAACSSRTVSNEAARPQVVSTSVVAGASGPANHSGYSQPGRLTEPRAEGGQPVVDDRAPDAAAGLPLEGRPHPVAEQHPEALAARARHGSARVVSCGRARSTA